MLDELILFFNSLNGPSLQVLKRSSLILESSSIFYLQSFATIYHPNQPHLSFFQHQMEERKVERKNLRFSQQNPHKHNLNTQPQQPTNSTLTQHTFETYFNNITSNN